MTDLIPGVPFPAEAWPIVALAAALVLFYLLLHKIPTVIHTRNHGAEVKQRADDKATVYAAAAEAVAEVELEKLDKQLAKLEAWGRRMRGEATYDSPGFQLKEPRRTRHFLPQSPGRIAALREAEIRRMQNRVAALEGERLAAQPALPELVESRTDISRMRSAGRSRT